MINPATTLGKMLLVFFWGGLSANIVVYVWLALRAFGVDLSPLFLPYFVVIVNMALLGFKNYRDPKVPNR